MEPSVDPRIDLARLPRHVGIIMDGNGRWAKKRFLPRIAGHREGVKAVDRVVSHARRMGIKALTLYSFSSENWNRPRSEIDALMEILGEYLKRELRRMIREDIRFNAIGHLEELSVVRWRRPLNGREWFSPWPSAMARGKRLSTLPRKSRARFAPERLNQKTLRNRILPVSFTRLIFRNLTCSSERAERFVFRIISFGKRRIQSCISPTFTGPISEKRISKKPSTHFSRA